MLRAVFAIVVLCLSHTALGAAETDILVADFESEDYGDWKVEGEAFGPGPAAGTLPGQMHVSGFKGKRLVNTFYKGDGTTGKLTSPPLKIDRDYLVFLIGGGAHEGKTCINLLVDGGVVRTAAGPNERPGGSEELEPHCWDATGKGVGSLFRGEAAKSDEAKSRTRVCVASTAAPAAVRKRRRPNTDRPHSPEQFA